MSSVTQIAPTPVAPVVTGPRGRKRLRKFGWNVVEDPIHINDWHATLLHLFGLNHLKLTYRFQGRDFRLTDVGGNVVTKLLA